MRDGINKPWSPDEVPRRSPALHPGQANIEPRSLHRLAFGRNHTLRANPMSDPTYTLVDSWQCMKPAEADAVCAFWHREHANVEGEEARRRVQQVLTRALDTQGNVIAVSTAEPCSVPRLGQPMYYYRCFVGADWRGKEMAIALLRRGFDDLERWATERDFPCIGILLELENEALAGHLPRAHWHRVGFSFIGRSPRGLDLRVRYFHNAELKPMP